MNVIFLFILGFCGIGFTGLKKVKTKNKSLVPRLGYALPAQVHLPLSLAELVAVRTAGGMKRNSIVSEAQHRVNAN